MVAALVDADMTVDFRTAHGVVRALTDANLSLHGGEILMVVGESGSGKTVLAHALLRLLPRNASVRGAVRRAGEELLSLPERRMREVRGRRISLIPQRPGASLNPVRKLGSQLRGSAKARGLSGPEADRQLGNLLGEFDLDLKAVGDSYVHQLSGGMQQRVVNALALVGQPEVVIADEPTSGLDADLIETTANQLRTIPARGAALLVITHDVRLAERLGAGWPCCTPTISTSSAPLPPSSAVRCTRTVASCCARCRSGKGARYQGCLPN